MLEYVDVHTNGEYDRLVVTDGKVLAAFRLMAGHEAMFEESTHCDRLTKAEVDDHLDAICDHVRGRWCRENRLRTMD